MNRKLLVLLAIFVTIGSLALAQTIKSESLYNIISATNYDYNKKQKLFDYISSILKYKGQTSYVEYFPGYQGVSYQYNKNGKYLFATEIEYGAGASGWESMTNYIFDMESIRLIPNRSIFINISDPAFQRLVIEYLSKHENYNSIDLNKALSKLKNYDFYLFYVKNGLGLQWDEYSIGPGAIGSPKIILPYSRVQNFLTAIGRDIFK